MVRRAGSALLLLGLIALAILGGRVAMLLVVIVVAVTTAGDLYRLLRSPEIVPAASVGHATTVALLVVAYSRGARAPAVFPFVLAVGLFLSYVVMLVRRDRTNVTRAVAATLAPVLGVALPAAYVVALRKGPRGYTLAWAFALMTLAAEIGATTATWFIRRRALTPRASRTTEHLTGAAAGAIIAAIVVVAAASPPFTWVRAIILSVLVAATMTAGDMGWAMIEEGVPRGAGKRHALALPSVGGALLSAPVFFYVFRALVS